MVYSLCEHENPTPSNFQIFIQTSLELPVAMYVCHAQFLLPHGHPFRSGGSCDSHDLSQVSWLVLGLLLLSLVIPPPWWIDPAPLPIASCQCKLVKDAQLLSHLSLAQLSTFNSLHPTPVVSNSVTLPSPARRHRAFWDSRLFGTWQKILCETPIRSSFIACKSRTSAHYVTSWGKHLRLLGRALPTCFLGIPYSCSMAFTKYFWFPGTTGWPSIGRGLGHWT